MLKSVFRKFLMVAIMAVATPAVADSVIDDVVKRGTLRVGLSTFVPWAFVNKQGQFVGYEVDVATQLAKDLGVKLELVPTAWDGIIPALNAGKFDMLIGGMSITTKRNLSVNFSVPYGGTELVVLAQPKYADVKIADINSRKYTFTARRGALPATVAKREFPRGKLLQFDDDGVSAQEVINGKADFTVTTGTEAATYIDDNPNKLVMLENGRAIEKTPSAIALRRGDVNTLNVVNNWILVKQNWLQARSDYWFKTKQWKDQLPK